MDIIRNLMLEGVKPDILIKRGATPKYVSMVCREIVEGSRKQKDESSWTETRKLGAALAPDFKAESSTIPGGLRLPSPGSVDLVRDPSASSISSVDASIKVERTFSPEQPTRLIHTSSWVPTPRLPNPPVRVESYRPSRPAGPSGTTSQTAPPIGQSSSISSSNAPLGPRLGPGGIPRPVVSKNSLRARASDLSPVVKRPDFLASDRTPVETTLSSTSTARTPVLTFGGRPRFFGTLAVGLVEPG